MKSLHKFVWRLPDSLGVESWSLGLPGSRPGRLFKVNLSSCFKFLSLFLAFNFFLLSSLSLVAQAEFIPPGDVSIKTDRYTPAYDSLQPGEYQYAVEWEGIPVAKAKVNVGKAFSSTKSTNSVPEVGVDTTVKVSASTSTSGIVKAFYKMTHRSESTFRKSDFQPVYYSSEQRENSKRKFRKIQFHPDGAVESERWRKGRDKSLMRFVSTNPVFDPVSAAFLAKSLPVEKGDKLGFDVYNGKHRFLINFFVEGVEEIKTARGPRMARKIVPKVFRLTDSEGEKKLRSATIWVSNDSKRELLKIESEVWIGSVTAELEGFRHVRTVSVDGATQNTAALEQASGTEAAVSEVPGSETKVSQAVISNETAIKETVTKETGSNIPSSPVEQNL